MKNTENPLVSVIIPCYNYANYIEECINSAINQTYENIEIIVIVVAYPIGIFGLVNFI